MQSRLSTRVAVGAYLPMLFTEVVIIEAPTLVAAVVHNLNFAKTLLSLRRQYDVLLTFLDYRNSPRCRSYCLFTRQS